MVTPIILNPLFERDEGLKELGGTTYLARLTANGQGLLNPRELANQICELSALRTITSAVNSPDVTIDDVSAAFEEVIAKRASLGKGLSLIKTADWERPAPPRRSAWGTWLPYGKTTLLTGDGGVGKSLLTQQLMNALALGLPFLGMETKEAPALYITAEDDADELWRRQEAINRTFSVSMGRVAQTLHLASLDGEADTALAHFDEDAGRLIVTPRWAALQAQVRRLGIRYVGLDNATDLLASGHNNAHAVAAFVNLLTGLAIEIDGIVLLLHHPNKAGDDWSGSQAWHNKVRSRLIIKRPGGDDPDARTIENPKANYSAAGSVIEFRWNEGSFIRNVDLSEDRRMELSETIAATGANSAFLACLRQRSAEGEGRGVGPTPGPNYAPSQFANMPQAKGYDKQALTRAMERLFATGQIVTETYRNKSKGRDVTIICEASGSSPNVSPNASRTHFPNFPELPPNAPRTDPAHSPSPTGRDSAALEAAAQPSLPDAPRRAPRGEHESMAL